MRVEKLVNQQKEITKPLITFFYSFYMYVFCYLPGKIFTEYMFVDQMNLQKRKHTSILNSS